MTDRLARMLEDKYLRDSARALVEADIEHLKTDVSQKSLATRAMERAREGAAELYEEAIDIADDKLGLARQFGATHTIDARDANHAEQVRDLTNGGVDFAVDLAGAIPAMKTAYEITRYGGTVVTAGLSPSTAEFSFIQSNLVSEEKAIKGSYMGSCVPVRDIPRFISLYRQGRLPIDKLIGRQVGLNGLNEGFDRLQKGEAIRQICIPHGDA